eukprot:3577937-Pleurochrysis_carterae.AAC.2
MWAQLLRESDIGNSDTEEGVPTTFGLADGHSGVVGAESNGENGGKMPGLPWGLEARERWPMSERQLRVLSYEVAMLAAPREDDDRQHERPRRRGVADDGKERFHGDKAGAEKEVKRGDAKNGEGVSEEAGGSRDSGDATPRHAESAQQRVLRRASSSVDELAEKMAMKVTRQGRIETRSLHRKKAKHVACTYRARTGVNSGTSDCGPLNSLLAMSDLN